MAEATPSGSGGPVQLSPPARDGSLAITGGVGGIAVQLDELDFGAAKLDVLADRLAAVEASLLSTWQHLGAYQHSPRITGNAALVTVFEAKAAVGKVRLELRRISSQVRNCRHDYEVAEARTHWLAGTSNPQIELQKHIDFWNTGFLNGDAVEMLVGDSAAALPSIKAFLEGAIPALRPGPVTATRDEEIPIDFEATPAGLLERVRLIEARGSGYIEVIEVDNQGTKAYVVVIPGTQVNETDGGTNPFDLNGITDGMGNNSAQVNAGILAALKSAGAEPGADVVAVGYSQGGIHAMNLSADSAFLSDYNMKYVLTAGSPISRITPPPDVSTLHLEHRTDWVPGSDGAANRDSRNQVTVRIEDDLYVRGGEDAGLGPGHRLTGYEDAARLVAASDDPSLVHSTAVLGGVLGAGGAATATRYSLTRAKAPATTLEPPDPRAHGRNLGGR